MEAEVEKYLRAHGTSKKELSAFFIKKEVYRFETKNRKREKAGRIQFSILGDKFKLYNANFWTCVQILRDNDSSCEWESIADILLDKCKDLKRAAKICEEFYEKLDACEPRFFLESSFRRYKSGLVETTKALSLAEQDKDAHQLDEGSSSRIDHDQGKRVPKLRANIGERFMSNILLGLGLQEKAVRERYTTSSELRISLDDRVKELKDRLNNHFNTFSQYIAQQNLFLLWLNHSQPRLFNESGAILASEGSVYLFLQKFGSGSVRLTGFEPSIIDVLENDFVWEPVSNESMTSLSYSYAHKWLSLLSELSISQKIVLNEPAVGLRVDSDTLASWEQNIKSKQTKTRQQDRTYIQKTVFQDENPLKQKACQSTHLLQMDTSLNIRNRSIGLTQLFSISRVDEIVK